MIINHGKPPSNPFLAALAAFADGGEDDRRDAKTAPDAGAGSGLIRGARYIPVVRPAQGKGCACGGRSAVSPLRRGR